MSRRILLLITDLEIGGTPTVVRELATRLNAPPGVLVEVACLKGWGPVADQLRERGVRVHALCASRTLDMPRVTWLLWRLVRRGPTVPMHRQAGPTLPYEAPRLPFDTVFSFLVHANAAAALVAPLCRGTRFIQSIQTTQPKPAEHWRVQFVAKFAAERIVVPSPSVARVARQWSAVASAKLAVIPNAIDPLAFAASHAPRDAPRPFPIGFVGRLDPIKRIPDLLRSVAMLDGLVELHVFGTGSERGRIEAEVARLNIADRVWLHGAVARPQDAMDRIGTLVLPSSAEGFGLVLIEAMAAGVPVVATDVDGIRDVVRDRETGLLVPPAQPEALAAAIRRLVSDVALRERLVAAAHADVRARFTWDVVLPQYRRLLGLTEPTQS